MPIDHKFLNENFQNGFETHNAILDVTPYEPEVLIVGTFNPATPNANFADFFYGRNYFWRGWKKMREPNYPFPDLGMRIPQNAHEVPDVLDPSIDVILNLATHFRLAFTDLITSVLHYDNPDYQMLDNDHVIYDGVEYNLIRDGAEGAVQGLAQLNIVGQVSWNNQIIEFIRKSPTIKYVYLTTKIAGLWGNKFNLISNADYNGRDIEFGNIYSPTAAGLPNFEGMGRLESLIHVWIWANNANGNPIFDRPGFSHFNHDWLIEKGVDPNHF